MILIGDNLVPYENLTYINTLNEINNSQANSTISFSYNEEILKYCYFNNISSAVVVNSIKEAIYSNSLNAKYIIANRTLACEIQKIADNYMYDSKVLSIIDSNEELEQIASFEIDGIIYKNLLN